MSIPFRMDFTLSNVRFDSKLFQKNDYRTAVSAFVPTPLCGYEQTRCGSSFAMNAEARLPANSEYSPKATKPKSIPLIGGTVFRLLLMEEMLCVELVSSQAESLCLDAEIKTVFSGF